MAISLSAPAQKCKMAKVMESFEVGSYQQALLEAAKRENIVACLATGAEQRLISALLIEDAFKRPKKHDCSTFTVFVSDPAPLVRQQADHLRNVLGKSVTIATFFGDESVDHWGKGIWAQSIKGKYLLFFTAKVLLSALRHDVIDFEMIELMIFDEAHHTTKTHPYNSIMRDIYFPSLRKGLPVPRIFGLSSSFVKAKISRVDDSLVEGEESYREQLAELEHNLHARVVIASEELRPVVESHLPEPDEFALMYEMKSDSIAINDKKEDKGHGEIEVEKRRKDVLNCDVFETSFCKTEIAPQAAMLVQKGWKDENDCNSIEAGASEKRSSDCDAIAKQNSHHAEKLARSVLEVRNELGSFFAWHIVNPQAGTVTMLPSAPLKVGQIAPKVLAVLDLIIYESRRWESLSNVETAFQCIIFVQRRDVAVALTWLIDEALRKCGTTVFEARVLLDNDTQSDAVPSDTQTTPSQKANSLRDFRTGNFGILVTTNAIKEVLDVPACSLVVMFNDALDFTSNIKRRGRVRSRAARYVILVPILGGEKAYSCEPLRKIRIAKHEAMAMKAAVPSLSILGNSKNALFEEPQCPDFEPDDAFCLYSNTTKARVLPSEALDLLHAYCTSLPKEDTWEEWTQGPVYEVFNERGGFTATVTLPNSSPVGKGFCREIQISHCIAKRLAAVDAYTKLYKCNAIDEHLLPFCYSSHRNGKAPKESMENAKERKDNRSRRERNVIVEPPLALRWPRPEPSNRKTEAVYLYEIVCHQNASNLPMESCGHRFGILTKHRLHNEDLFALMAPKGERLLDLIPRPSFNLSPERDTMATVFGLKLYQTSQDRLDAIMRRDCPGYMPLGRNAPDSSELEMPGFHLLPLSDDGGSVDWSAIEDFVRFNPNVWNSNTVRDFYPSEVVSLENKLIQSMHDATYRIYFTGSLSKSTFVKSSCTEFLGSRWRGTFEEYYRKRHDIQIQNVTGSMLPGYPKSCIHRKLKKPFFLAPELCRIIPLSPWALHYLTLMPFWQIFMALQDFRRRCSIDSTISFSQLAEALQPRRSSSHCVGVNYERLEFLGDAVLKVLASIVAFSGNPLGHEGPLTRTRDALVSNQYLCDRSISLGFQNVLALTGASIKPKSWPFFLACPQKSCTDMSEKLLADCIESLIGLYFVHGGLKMSAQLLVSLQIIPELQGVLGSNFFNNPLATIGCTTADNRTCSPHIAKIEKLLGYSFKKKGLLVDALTHKSYRGTHVRSYERLEFLGDAVMGYVILKNFYNDYPNLDPAELTLLREPALSNELFARVTCEYGFQKYLWHDSFALENELSKSANAFAEESSNENICETLSVSKVLGDILESIVGAVVVDQNMTFDVADELVHRLMKNALDRFANPLTMGHHPVTAMNQALQAQYKHAPEIVYEETHKEGVNEVTNCTVLMNGVAVGSCEGSDRRKAKRGAALMILQRLDESTAKLNTEDSGESAPKRARKTRLAIRKVC